MTHKIGYPYSYGDDLTSKMAGNNRKQAVWYSVLILSIWWHNLGFREPILSYPPFSNEPKRAIVRVVETPRVNSINRGGELGKSGPGPRAKADALKNARKTGGGSIFVQGFTPKRQYGSRPINKLLSCRNNVKINEEQFNGNKNTAKQTNQDCTLTREQLRNLTHPDDVIIPDQYVKIRHGQAKYKVKNHGSDFSLPSKPNEKGWLKTPRTSENIESFKDEIKKLVLTVERIEGTYRKGEPDQFSAIHFYDSVSGCNAIFKQETKEFVSAWKLTQGQVSDLLTNKNIGDY
jgi:hypothetical protein